MKDNERIIQSLLDLDFYKLTMAQVAWRYFPNVPVKYSFKNRTLNVNLADYISKKELRLEFDHIRKLKFTKDEIGYLRESKYIKRGLFKEGFLKFLQNLQLPKIFFKEDKNTYRFEIKGFWPEIILWETLILSVINELYYRSLLIEKGHTAEIARTEGEKRLARKIKFLRRNPLIKFVEFGTRRRFSRDWQEFIVKKLISELPAGQLLGTSNVFLAKKFDLRPIGTFAHEMFMIFSGIYHRNDEEIRASHNKVLQIWWQEYGESLSIALTDTYGSDFFFKDFTDEQARSWRGLRQDSGNPLEFGEKAIKFYQDKSIDPKTKTILFSDGLDIDMMLKIAERFIGRTNVTFGWGTNLTNDCGYKPLSLVVKPIESCGHPVVKLSDNVAKAIGNPKEIKRFKRIFGYKIKFDQSCVY